MQAICKMSKQSGFRIVGLTVLTTNNEGKAVDDINALWLRFAQENVLEQIKNRLDDNIYAVYTDYQGDHTEPYRLIIGCRVPANVDTPEGMHSHDMPGGEYGTFSAKGEQPRAIINTWQLIWAADIKRHFTADYEEYGPGFFDPGRNEVKIHIAMDPPKDKSGNNDKKDLKEVSS